MYPKNTATVKYEGTNINAITLGTMAKCVCGASIVYNGRPYSGGALGTYVTDPTPDFGAGGHFTYVASEENVMYSSSSHLPGYRFN